MEELSKGQLQSYRGGVAGKLGNTYEGDWAVQQALLVLQADALSLAIEPLGVAEGFEFIVQTSRGAQYHQCKRRSPKARHWTVTAIAQTGFFESVLPKHQADPNAEFAFVSMDSAGDISRVAEHAKRLDTPDEFFAVLSQDDRTALSDLVAQSSVADEAGAHALLKKVRFIAISDTYLRESVTREARRLFLGDGPTACDVLGRLLEDHLSKTLTTERLRGLAGERKLDSRPAALDATTLEKIKQLNERYEESHGPLGVAGQYVSRPISDEIANRLAQDGDTDFVVLTGVAGAGKSGVLRQSAIALEAAGIPCLRLRLDSLLQFTTADELGAALFGPSESPTLTLSLLAPENGFAVLILDQLDAVSEASGRTIEARELALNLIREARHYRNLKLIVACRSYDLDTDRRLQNLGAGPRSKRFNAELLDAEEDVKPFLARLGIDDRAITQKQWELIRLPVNLVHFAQLCLEKKSIITAGSTAELYRELLEKRADDLRIHHLAWSLPFVLGVLAERMSETRTLTAPLAAIDQFDRAAKLLVSGHLLNRDGDVVRFAHESLFDYCFARAFVARGTSLFTWLTGDEQILFRRTQVRQVLQLLRSADRPRYLDELDLLLGSGAVRAHIKDAVSSWLGTLGDPTSEELDICLKRDTGVGAPSFIVRRAFGSAPWVRLLQDRGLVATWLNSADAERKDYAFRLLDIALDGEADIAAEVLRAWWNNDDRRIPELLHWLRYPRSAKRMDAVVDLYVDVIDKTSDAIIAGGELPDEADLGLWAHHKSDALARLLSAWIARWYRAHETGHPFGAHYSDSTHWLSEAAKAHPEPFLLTVLSAFAEAFRREIAEGRATSRYQSAFRAQLPDANDGDPRDDRYIFDIVRNALRALAADDPAAAARVLEQLRPFEHYAAVHLALEAIDAGGEALAPLARELAKHPLLFHAGYEEGPSDSGARALASVWPALRSVDRETVERRVLSHYPEIAKAAERVSRNEPEQKRYALMSLKGAGAAQRNILARLGHENLSPHAQQRLNMLTRKFPTASWPQSRNRSGWVASPISLEKAKQLSDANWLRAINKHNRSRDELRFTTTDVIGGVEQLSRVLQECAKADPERCVALAEAFPSDTHPDYPRALVRGVAESEASDDAALRAAKIAIASSDPEMDRALCYLVEKHRSLGRHDVVFDEVLRLARALPSPPDREDTRPRKADKVTSIQDMLYHAARHESLAMNSARGDAIHALAEILWETPARYEPVLTFTQRAVETEASRAMRVALIRCAHAIAGREPDEGVKIVLRLTEADATPLATQTGIRLVSWIFWNRRQAGTTLLDRLFSVEEFVPAALYLLAHYAVEDDEAATRFEPMWPADALARRMAADAAVQACKDMNDEPGERTQRWLKQLFHDSDDAVLKEAAGFGRYVGGAGRDTREQLALAHLASPSFRVDPDDILHGLDRLGAEYPDVVVAACKAFFAAEEDAAFRARQRGGAGRHWLARMMFGAYPALEKKPAFRSAILDAIDQFLTNDLADAQRELREFERH